MGNITLPMGNITLKKPLKSLPFRIFLLRFIVFSSICCLHGLDEMRARRVLELLVPFLAHHDRHLTQTLGGQDHTATRTCRDATCPRQSAHLLAISEQIDAAKPQA